MNRKLWVYPATRRLTNEEIQVIEQSFLSFSALWTGHGKPVQSELRIVEGQFLALLAEVEDGGISGCAIDKSMQWVKDIESQLGLSLTDRSLVFFKSGEDWKSTSFFSIKKAVEEGLIGSETLVAQTQVSKEEDFSNLLVPAKESWLSKYFSKVEQV